MSFIYFKICALFYLQMLQIHTANVVRKYCCGNSQETRIPNIDCLTANRTLIFKYDVSHDGFCGYEAVAKVILCDIVYSINNTNEYTFVVIFY